VDQFSVSLAHEAAKYIERCDAPTRQRLKGKFEKLKSDPFSLQHSKALKGRNDQRSARVGGIRILFRVAGKQIIVVAIGPRGQVYKHGS
jgi:mRNA-degrading endonuclease RelE of RelBE toxin-antitoxin system